MSDQPITVDINGKIYDGWNHVTVSKTIEDLSGSFTITLSRSQSLEFPIKQGSSCVILVNGESVINGFVEKIAVDTEVDKHEIKVSGRDKTMDVNDSTIIIPTLQLPFTLETVARKTLNFLGIKDIKIINNIKDLTPFDKIDGNIEGGGTAFDFIETYAKKKQVLLTTNGNGDIVFTRASTDKVNTVLTMTRNSAATILSSKVVYDNSKRFNIYEATSQAQLNSDYFSNNPQPVAQLTSIKAKAVDNDIRRGRIYSYVPKGTTVKFDLNDKVKWELNFRKAQSFIYNAIVRGFKPQDDKGIWTPNKLITVNDEFAQLNGTFLIVGVQFDYALNKGSKTTLKIMDRDAFTTIITKPEKQKKTTNTGGDYFSSEPAQHKG
jgi:prophage tail gpP-like protein